MYSATMHYQEQWPRPGQLNSATLSWPDGSQDNGQCSGLSCLTRREQRQVRALERPEWSVCTVTMTRAKPKTGREEQWFVGVSNGHKARPGAAGISSELEERGVYALN